MHLKLAESESTFDYFRSTRNYLAEHGKPIAFYSDKHAVFRVNKAGATGGTGMIQFGRALNESNIDIICANTSQSKGRVERANKTRQDRLVKEMRLAGVSTREEGNQFIPDFLTQFNKKFARPPKSDKNRHRPLTDFDDPDRVMSWQESRVVSKNLTIQYDKVLFMIDPDATEIDLRRKSVMVHDYPDGRLEIYYQNERLPYSHIDKPSQVKQGEITSNKRLGAALIHSLRLAKR